MKFTPIFILMLSTLCHANGSLVNSCKHSNNQFFPTTTVGCTINITATHHLLIAWGHSCIANGCSNVGTQATHTMNDDQVNNYTKTLDTLFTDTGQSGTRDRMTIWWEETGTTTGNYTITLTLNTASGNDIEVQEWAGLVTSSPVTGTGSPVSTQGFYNSGGTPPIPFNSGTITINGAANTGVILGDLNGNSGYLAMFIGFKAIGGLDLLYLFGDCNNCGGTFQNVQTGYTKNDGSLGQDGNDVFLSFDALPGIFIREKKGWVF